MGTIQALLDDIPVDLITLLHSERPKLYTILAFLSAIGLKCMTDDHKQRSCDQNCADGTQFGRK